MVTVSVVLRLLGPPLAEGRICGHAEIVETGETFVFKNLDEVAHYLRARQGRQPRNARSELRHWR